MSRLTDLIAATKAKDPTLGAELEREFKALSSRRQFGLNFERHRPEAVELPQRPVRKGDKVRILPPRGSTERGDQRLWRVTRIEKVDGARLAHLRLIEDDSETATSAVEDLVVVAEFRDPIYPGLVSTGKVERGGDKPFHTVINAENYHALKALTFTHKGKVDAIYIDPPYNTGAKDWKYNNDYVEGDDRYRHSKWLAFMERRLLLARDLLNPADSVLVLTIDEKEYLRVGLLLEQVFPEARVQMVSITISPRGTSRTSEFSRVDEYAFFVFIGTAEVSPSSKTGGEEQEVRWQYLRRTQKALVRGSRPNQFYAVYVDRESERIVHIGEPMGEDEPLDGVPEVPGAVPVFPVDPSGLQLIWGLTPGTLRSAVDKGYVRVTKGNEHQPYTIAHLSTTNIARAEAGDGLRITGHREDGSKIVVHEGGKAERLSTVWREARHDAGAYGTTLLRSLLPGRSFPFPKSLYAVEDTLRSVLARKPDAIVLDFFAGSGTTAHAIMRLNRQDGGRRTTISVTNNEVSPDEHRRLRLDRLRPGDADWERLGICEHITKPRIEAAITGASANGYPLEGDYKFVDEFPMADGLAANAEFFTLTYEAPVAVSHNRAFERIAPLLWLRAGARGARVGQVPSDGWAVVEAYGVLFDLDQAKPFCDAVAEVGAGMAFVVTDDDRRFQAVVRRLPEAVEPVRLYESYLSNFRFASGE